MDRETPHQEHASADTHDPVGRTSVTDQPVSSVGSPVQSTPRTVGAHQPNYLPWLGYIHKIARSDVFVFLDDVEYTDGSWINRNKIKTPDGWTWLTVPVHGSSGPIKSIEIAGDDWQTTHRKSLQQNYANAAAYDEFANLFDTVYDRSWDSLCELNIHLVRQITDRLDLECRFVRSSSLDIDATKSDRIVRLCAELEADRYLSGTGARSYLEADQFDAAGVDLTYQSLSIPEYDQRFGSFIPQLSVVDALCNVGSAGTIELLQAMGDP